MIEAESRSGASTAPEDPVASGKKRIIQIVALIDDEDDDEFLFRRTLRKAGIAVSVIRLTGGQDAINYFARAGRYVDAALYPAADVAFLDVKMPAVTGFDVLIWLQRNLSASRPFITMLSSSDHPTDRGRALDLGADEYLVKPPSPAKLENLLKSHGLEWPLAANKDSQR